MTFIYTYIFFWKSLKKLKKLELSLQNFRYDVLHPFYSGIRTKKIPLKYGFCKKSHQKNATLTSWTLFLLKKGTCIMVFVRSHFGKMQLWQVEHFFHKIHTLEKSIVYILCMTKIFLIFRIQQKHIVRLKILLHQYRLLLEVFYHKNMFGKWR